jgi:hypothetical protein
VKDSNLNHLSALNLICGSDTVIHIVSNWKSHITQVNIHFDKKFLWALVAQKNIDINIGLKYAYIYNIFDIFSFTLITS